MRVSVIPRILSNPGIGYRLNSTMNDCSAHSQNVYLVGFMGSGKSTIGPLLAQRLGFKFVDLDQLIEKQSGKTIVEIFETHGEDYFRSLETAALMHLSSGQKSVIALGGGTFVTRENRELVKESGTSVWLKVSLEEAVRRCRKESQRPLAHDETHFEDLYKRRQPVYQHADIHIETEGKDSESICDLILQKFTFVC